MTDGVSCLCLTYGRPLLLEEAIESFFRQQWNGPKELIIVNDHPDQELVYDHDEVVVINLRRRLRTLGEKRNLSVALAKYDYLLIWDDDDIHLPWRIEETMRVLPEAWFFKCPKVWLMNRNKLEAIWHGELLFHGAAAYSRNIFEKVGGYKFMNGGEDKDFEHRVKLELDQLWKTTELSIDRMYYIYRWEHGYYHATGCKDLKEIDPKVQAGKHHLRPQWAIDYCSVVSSQIRDIAHEKSNGNA